MLTPAVVAVLLAVTAAGACTDDTACGAGEVCHGEETCADGTCIRAFALPVFPLAGLTAYDAAMIAVLDHTGPFYPGCCDDDVAAYSGERARRTDGAVFCPVAGDDFPACLSDTCRCGFGQPEGGTFTVNGAYASPFGPEFLYYVGHAGYDIDAGLGAPIVAPRAGTLCKAVEDPVNGRAGFATAWDKFLHRPRHLRRTRRRDVIPPRRRPRRVTREPDAGRLCARDAGPARRDRRERGHGSPTSAPRGAALQHSRRSGGRGHAGD